MGNLWSNRLPKLVCSVKFISKKKLKPRANLKSEQSFDIDVRRNYFEFIEERKNDILISSNNRKTAITRQIRPPTPKSHHSKLQLHNSVSNQLEKPLNSNLVTVRSKLSVPFSKGFQLRVEQSF